MIHVHNLYSFSGWSRGFLNLPPKTYHWQSLKSIIVEGLQQRIWLILTKPSPDEKPILKRYTADCTLAWTFLPEEKKIGRQPRRELRQINYARSWKIADIGTRVYPVYWKACVCCTVQVGPYTGLDTKLALPRAKRTLHALARLRATFSKDRRIRTIPCILCFYFWNCGTSNGYSNSFQLWNDSKF